MGKNDMNTLTKNILLVDDNIGDGRLINEIMLESKLKIQLSTVTDGLEAIDFLFQKGKYVNAALPNLIILDLNLPKKDGREVLAEIKNNSVIKKIPVIILTASENEGDIMKAYELHANCYITKPLSLEKFTRVLKLIEEFWFSIVQLPK
jgi:CheY-like chemotaxis protein